MIDRTIEVERMEHVISVFGSFDQNLRLIETELNVKILDRDNLIHITGEEEGVMLAEKAINGLLELAARGEAIDAQNVRYILGLVRSGKESEIQKLAGVGDLRAGLLRQTVQQQGVFPHVQPHDGVIRQPRELSWGSSAGWRSRGCRRGTR